MLITAQKIAEETGQSESDIIMLAVAAVNGYVHFPPPVNICAGYYDARIINPLWRETDLPAIHEWMEKYTIPPIKTPTYIADYLLFSLFKTDVTFMLTPVDEHDGTQFYTAEDVKNLKHHLIQTRWPQDHF